MPECATVNPEAELEKYGVPPGCVLTFADPPKPRLLDYLDFTDPPRKEELRPDGVAESQDRPLLFFVSESHLAVPVREQKQQLSTLRRTLACRGQRAYLAVVRPGQLDVVPVSLAKRTPEWQEYRPGTGRATTFFSRLALGDYDGAGEPRYADYAFKEMLKLLRQASEELAAPAHGLSKDDVLSLVGRALFFRFLLDRRIVKDKDIEGIAPGAGKPEACFGTPEHASATSGWLDETFNGDFLPLRDNGSLAFFEEAGKKTQGGVFSHLNAIMGRHQALGGRTYQRRLWSDFDFAHVPVGLLSQVYEAFCWRWDPYSAGATSVYYTPRNIAATVVGEVFDKLPDAHQARVLDPACGGGVFLVLAFRRIYQELWRRTDQRPDTRAIRRIMERQLTGFDISESALRLAALSLYLTAVELDPEPVPPRKLKFAKLQTRVLFNWRQPTDPERGPVIGSLGDHVGRAFDGQFDIVLSNPPWTRLRKRDKGLGRELKAVGWEEDPEDAEGYLGELAERFTVLSQDIIRRRGEPQLARKYQNPNKVPDLPILWKSTEWCKPGGRIAMALPARILLKQEDVPTQARDTLLQLVEVTGVINGSNLVETPVWPRMKQPFILLFARNCRPKGAHTVQFISPHRDVLLNRKGELRIDSKSLYRVEVEAASEEPWLWKTLAVGTALDAEVVRRVRAANGTPVKEYWTKELGLSSRTGYRIDPGDPGQQDARFLRDLRNLAADYEGRFSVDVSGLPRFRDVYPGRDKARWPREREVYRAPLVLLKQSPGEDRKDGWALLCLDDVAFTRDYYGYSAAAHPDGEGLARYLFLFCHSWIWLHYLLVTAPVFGAERRVVYKADLDDCPIVPFERLSPEQRREIRPLADRLAQGDQLVFRRIDSFFAGLYGLDELDLEVIRDTLEVCLPYEESRERACEAPGGKGQERFRRRLERLLRPFFEVVGEEPVVSSWKPEVVGRNDEMPFGVMLIGKKGQPQAKPDALFRDRVLPLANETGASQIFEPTEGGLLVAILNQYRYWTPSRARLCAAEILRYHMGAFGG